jgi:hypothetical protein
LLTVRDGPFEDLTGILGQSSGFIDCRQRHLIRYLRFQGAALTEPRLNRGERAMANFIFEANIAHYKELLASETDAGKIAMIQKLLAEEEAKFAE